MGRHAGAEQEPWADTEHAKGHKVCAARNRIASGEVFALRQTTQLQHDGELDEQHDGRQNHRTRGVPHEMICWERDIEPALRQDLERPFVVRRDIADGDTVGVLHVSAGLEIWEINFVQRGLIRGESFRNLAEFEERLCLGYICCCMIDLVIELKVLKQQLKCHRRIRVS